MKFCSNCGEPLSGKNSFCTSCGQKNNVVDEKVVPKGKPLSKGRKITILSILLVVAIVIITHFIMKNIYTSHKSVEMFEQALQGKDYNKLAEIMNDGQDVVEVDSAQAKEYAQYLDEHVDTSKVMKYLRTAASKLDHDEKVKPYKDYENKLLLLEKGKKKWGIYTQYDLKFYPIAVYASADYENTDIFLNDEKATTIGEDDTQSLVGYLFPSKVTLEATYKNDYINLSTKDELYFDEASHNKLEVPIELDAEEVVVYSNDDSAVLFVNGKSTGQKIADIDYFGPVKTDESITFHAERKVNGKVEKTESVKVDDEVVHLLFNEDKKIVSEEPVIPEFTEEDVYVFMKDYYTSAVEAINSGDFSRVSDMLDPTGKAYRESKDYGEYLFNKGITEELQGMELNSFKQSGNGFEIVTKEHYTIFYEDGSEKNKVFETKNYATVFDGELKIHTLISTTEL
ncbi:zinc ribbon domain-containing protein [Bacillus sp. JJ722]|uniref:zinc ribbon domain-containing protein n=1 Tax=Bacillus sp. JJ722 TaxID=3122973 RepID=UPI003000F680